MSRVSVKLKLEGFEEGFQKLLALYRDGKLNDINGMRIEKITKDTSEIKRRSIKTNDTSLPFSGFPFSYQPVLVTPESYSVVVPLAVSIVDLFRPELVMEVEVYGGSGAWKFSILDGLVVLRGGEGKRLTIRGKAGYCEAVIQQLQEQGVIVTIVS